MPEEKPLKHITTLIRQEKNNEAFEKLPEKLVKDCRGLIIKRGRGKLAENEATSVFYEAFEAFCKQVNKEGFRYETEKGFENYLKEVCKTTLLKYLQSLKGTVEFVKLIDELDSSADTIEREIEVVEAQIIEKEQKYGVKFGKKAWTWTEIKGSYDTLCDECKMLVTLKFLFGHSHKEISNKLRYLYNIKNENVSRVKLHRCLEKIRI